MEIRNKSKARRTSAVVFLVCLLLQLAFSGQISIFGSTVNFLMVFAGVVALSSGSSTGVVAGFVAGLFYDFTSAAPVGLMMLVLTVASFAAGMGGRNRLAESFADAVRAFAVMALASNVAYSVGLLLAGVEHNVLFALLGAVVAALLTTVVFCPFALVLANADGGGHGFSAKQGGKRFRKVR